jgi:putative two-component system response regulator
MSKVLIVDDDEGQIELLKAYLAGEVDEISGLTDSRQVESVFAEFQPDAVVLDLHMPQPDGLEVLRRLRGARSSLGFLPVLMLTGDKGHIARNAALILGADEFVTKPVDRSEFVLRMRNLLHTRELYVAAREGRTD